MNVEFKLPELGENIESGDIVNVLVRQDDRIVGNQGVIELETDKAVLELPCPHAGRVVTIHVNKGDTVTVGQTLLTIDVQETAHAPEATPSDATPRDSDAPAAQTTPRPDPSGDALIPAGPAARRVARELGVELRKLHGSGPHGRITVDDVQGAAAGPEKTVLVPGQPATDAWGPTRIERMSKIRRTIAAQMTRAAGTIPHVTNFDDADVTDLEHLRKGVPRDFLGPGVKLTSMPFVMKAVAVALSHHPALNASIDDQRERIVYKQYVNLGVAVDTPRGLVVPVMRAVDRMTIPQIARGLGAMADRARNVQLGIEDLRGGTFTLSNLGAVGGTYSTPIINHPEVALLLVGRSRWMPVVRGSEIEKRLMMPLSLSYDHRLIDGGTAGRFLNQVIDYLQSPAKLLLME